MAWGLGVDLGTTFTAAAVARDGRTEIVTLGSQRAAVPSIVLLRDDGTALIGEAAARRAVSEPTRVAREFKRRIGDATPFLVGGTPVSPEALMARILRSVVSDVTELEGSPPDRVAVTHPANWGEYKREILVQALRLADIDDATLVTEPEAAAIHYASMERVEVGSVVAVYDLGGGTFDAAVLRKTPTGFEVLGEPQGVERLGGIDFDAAVLAHVDAVTGGAVSALDSDDPASMAAVARLRDDCTLAKEALSSDFDTSIPLMLPGLSTEVRMTRAELEAMIRPSLGDTITALQRAIRSAGLEPQQIDRVLLVGGSARIPLVSQYVAEAIGRPTAIDAHPKHAVALGAAMVAAADLAPLPEPLPAAATVPLSPSPPLSAVPLPPPLPPPATRQRRGALVPVLVVIALLAAAGAAVALLAGRGDEKRATGTTATTSTSTSGSTIPAATVSTAVPPGPLRPLTASATSVLPSQKLSCNGETVTYAATNAIDDDPQTGWGTQEPDGTGQQLVVRFDAPVHLTSVSMTPGYTRVGPTSRNGCQPTSRFFENRIIDRVRYTFDDGQSVEQSFTPDPRSQSMAVAASTRTVTIEILQTELPAGPNVDDNTVISDVSFAGSA